MKLLRASSSSQEEFETRKQDLVLPEDIESLDVLDLMMQLDGRDEPDVYARVPVQATSYSALHFDKTSRATAHIIDLSFLEWGQVRQFGKVTFLAEDEGYLTYPIPGFEITADPLNIRDFNRHVLKLGYLASNRGDQNLSLEALFAGQIAA